MTEFADGFALFLVVAAVVVITVVVIVIFLTVTEAAALDVVDDKGDIIHQLVFGELVDVGHLVFLGYSLAKDKDIQIGVSAAELAVGDQRDRRIVHDHIIVLFPQAVKQVFHFRLVEQFRGIRRNGSCRDEAEIFDGGSDDHFLQLILAAQVSAQAMVVGNIENLMDPGLAHISPHEHHLFVVHSQDGGKVHRGKGFSLSRTGRVDGYHLAVAVGEHKLQVGPDTAVGFGNSRTGIVVNGQIRIGSTVNHVAKDGQTVLFFNVFLDLDGVGHHAADDQEDGRDGEAKRQADQDLQHL